MMTSRPRVCIVLECLLPFQHTHNRPKLNYEDVVRI
jgi:hypothetical protein